MGELYNIRKNKKKQLSKENVQSYFWRNYNQQEIDLIEIKEGKRYMLMNLNIHQIKK